METWKKILSHPVYSVSDMGRIRRDVKAGIRGRPVPYCLKPSMDANGYAVVSLYNKGQARKLYVHRIVALSFLGPAPSVEHHVAHFNGDGMDARLANLRWATQSENEADKVRHGRDRHCPRGSRIFSDRDIARLRKLRSEGLSLRAIAAKFETSHTNVSLALKNGSALP